ncbi:MAG: DUF4112 domain-containing protein [Rhizobiales bacterium]|nr:DUF4112 domain-containing protein [Hyphomicrobiales bacterium]
MARGDTSEEILEPVREKRSAGPKRAPIIDQDGNDARVRSGSSRSGFAGRMNQGGFTQGLDFENISASLGDMQFGKLTREQRFARLDALAKLLDVAFVLPGTKIRYGVDGLVGLIPVVGDILTTAISLWIVREARSLGAPRHVVARMLGNVALDGVVGLVPFVGDAFDVMFRANIRNMRILRKWMEKQPRMDV